MSQKCCGLFGWLFGHKFEAQYDETQEVGKFPTPSSLMFAEEPSSIYNSMKLDSKFYRYSVCKRCGEIAKENTK